MKAAFKAAGLPVGDFLWFTAFDWQQEPDKWLAAVKAELGFPCFIKPANLGSSVGISKANNEQQ